MYPAAFLLAQLLQVTCFAAPESRALELDRALYVVAAGAAAQVVLAPPVGGFRLGIQEPRFLRVTLVPSIVKGSQM